MHAKLLQLCPTPWTIAFQATLSMGVSRQEYWSRLPCTPPGDLPNPGTELMSLISPALAGGFFTTSATWEALYYVVCVCVSRLVVSDSATPWTVVHQATVDSVHGILQARIVEWVAISFSRGSSRPRDRTQVSHTEGRFFTI